MENRFEQSGRPDEQNLMPVRRIKHKQPKLKPRSEPYFPTPTVGKGKTVDLPFNAEWLPDYINKGEKVDPHTAAYMMRNREYLEGLNARLTEVQPFDADNLQPLVLGGVELGRQFVEPVLEPNVPVAIAVDD